MTLLRSPALMLMISLLLLAGCEDTSPNTTSDTTPAETDATEDATTAEDGTAETDAEGDVDPDSASDDVETVEDTGPVPIGGCAADDLAACVYMPESAHSAAEEEPVELDYVDATGFTRQVRVHVRYPQGTADGDNRPVVVWSHGGSSGRANPTTVGVSWGEAFVEAGYVFVAVAHLGRDNAQRQPLCSYLGFDVAGCAEFKYLNWDRPHDVAAVFDWLEERAASDLAGRIDMSRLLYAGHSAGAGSAMMVAGATRVYAGNVGELSDARPMAFMGCSPQGPGDDDFTDESFSSITRPFLTLTGSGDDTSGNVAENRRVPFTLMPAGDKALGWIEEETARHTTFNLETQACENEGGTPERCETYRVWLRSAALAFADAHIKDRAEAWDWLASTNASVLSEGVMEWERR